MRLILVLLGGTLLLGACSTSPGPSSHATLTGRPFAERIDGVAGLENFAKIHEGLYRGAQPTREGLRALKARGIRTVINLRLHHSNKEDVEACGMTAVEIPLQAGVFGSEPPTEEQLRLFFEVILDPARQPVFFHCAHGKDRTGTMAALYRIEAHGWPAEDAIEEMQVFGYHDIYQDLINFVRSYKPRELCHSSRRKE